MIPDYRLDVTGSPVIRSTAWLDAIIHDDCFRVLPEMPDKSVDAVITDPPYGVTGNHWDIAPNLPLLWKELRRVCKGRIVITATQPFATDVINSNRENFKWDDVWVKPPSSAWRFTRSAPALSRWVASVWRSLCGLIFFSMPAFCNTPRR